MSSHLQFRSWLPDSLGGVVATAALGAVVMANESLLPSAARDDASTRARGRFGDLSAAGIGS